MKLNGGPGSTSQLGNFFELGPFSLEGEENDRSEKARNNTWNQNFNLLVIDQPISAGASFAESYDDVPKSEEALAQHFYNALNEFYQLPFFKNFTKTPLFITGESYAGKFIPSITQKILQENALPNNTFKINLAGIAIGDGWTSPLTIIKELGMYGYNLGNLTLFLFS